MNRSLLGLLLLTVSVFSNGEDDLITDLPGLLFKTDFKSYSGYVDANDNGTWRMHYMLTESRSKPDTDPLLVWFNGGPGCSSLGGLFEELGPFYVNFDGETLYENPYAWNAKANVLYLESPIGVGYSYDTNTPNFFNANDDQSAQQNLFALTNFFKTVQPKYANRTFYLSGESYAGIYIPMLTDLIIQGINNGSFPNKNFQGSAIGNGFMNVRGLLNALALWSAYHGRVSLQDWASIKTNCSKGADMDNFDFAQYTNSSNLIDYVGDGSYCGNLIQPLISQNADGTEGFDQYNFYQECYDKSVFQAPAPPATGKRVKRSAIQGVSAVKRNLHYAKLGNFRGTSDLAKNTAALVNRFSNDNQFGYFCWNEDPVSKYLNSDKVQNALHIPQDWKKQNNTWQDCRDSIYNNYKLTYNTTNQFFNSIIKNAKTDFRFLIYNGDVDTVCNYLGDAKHILQVANDNKLTSGPRTPWFYSDNQQLAGYVQTYSGKNGNNATITIDLLTVKGAGHMVPYDRAGPSVQMISNFVWAKPSANINYTSQDNFDPNIQLSELIDTGNSSSVSILLALFTVLINVLL
uniref:Carboxypeptidase n=1 Tax=Caenorhabditis japonica TaxID=281687 RepID=A0A8R1DXL2_CAEJA